MARTPLSNYYVLSHPLRAYAASSVLSPLLTVPAFVVAKRALHSSASKDAAVPLSSTPSSHLPPLPQLPRSTRKSHTVAAPLAELQISQIVRTYLITTVSSSPILLSLSTNILRQMLESRNPLFRIDSNPVLRKLLWGSFYKQFCAGETSAQVAQTCDHLRRQGYAGVILEYALEVLKDAESNELHDISIWRQGMLDSINMAASGDFVGLKWSGMGPAAMRRMKNEEPPSAEMEEAMHAVCKSAAVRNVALLPAAEETWTLNGFHDWCLNLQRVYNSNGKSVVYSTYQAYLKQTPETLSKHLATAEREGFTLGIKLVRGAYLGSEKRDLIYPSIEGTHHAYDRLMSAIIHRAYNEMLLPATDSLSHGKSLPDVNFVIASHNAVSVEKAQQWRREQVARGERLTPLVFAQLQGMADEVSCSLIAAGKAGRGNKHAVQERVLKCTTWGSMYQCLNYLLRRAAENKDAASRTLETRAAMQTELIRRFKAMFGLNT